MPLGTVSSSMCAPHPATQDRSRGGRTMLSLKAFPPPARPVSSFHTCGATRRHGPELSTRGAPGRLTVVRRGTWSTLLVARPGVVRLSVTALAFQGSDRAPRKFHQWAADPVPTQRSALGETHARHASEARASRTRDRTLCCRCHGVHTVHKEGDPPTARVGEKEPRRTLGLHARVRPRPSSPGFTVAARGAR